MKRKTKTILFSISGIVILIAIPFIFIFALIYFTFPDLSSQYGMTTISVDGKQLYFKRETRGLNYDTIVLSPNNNYCSEYNPETDFRFPTLDTIIYYKVNDDVLHLITSTAIPPKNFPVEVEIQEVKEPGEWFRHKRKA